MAISEKSVADATLLAIEEINEAGGLLGRKIEPVIADGQSDWPTFASEADGEEDVYREKLNPDNPEQYFYDGQWRDITTETIELDASALEELGAVGYAE